jgi:hypothetical protein
MEKHKVKIWFGLGSYLLASASPLAVSAAETAKNSVSDGHAQATMVAQANAEGEGGEGGEGGGGGGAPQLATNDAAYLTQLGLIRGHLNVGFDLYQQGEVDAAKTHMKHPGDELYAALEPAFAARGVPGFAKQLETLAAMVQREAALSQGDWVSLQVTSWRKAESLLIPLIRKEDGGHGDEAGGGGRRI